MFAAARRAGAFNRPGTSTSLSGRYAYKAGRAAFKPPRRSVIPRVFGGTAALERRYSTRQYRSGGTPHTLDLQFTGAYAAGVYTVDTQPLQMLPMNTSTNVVQSLNLIQQGNGIGQRNGNKVALKSLRLKLGIQATGVAYVALQRARVMVIYDRSPNGAYSASTTILANSLQSNTIGTGDMWSDIDPDKFDRYTVLMNKMLCLQPLDNVVTSNQINGPTSLEGFGIDAYIKLRDLECMYGSTSNPATIANQTIGSLQLLVLGDLAANSEQWQLRGAARLRFHDL